jgi:DNA-binding GntR family transcriptional regulator
VASNEPGPAWNNHQITLKISISSMLKLLEFMDFRALPGKDPHANLLLVKDNLAAYFRREIVSGRLAPGAKIVEVKYARLLKLSQTSVREAINILISEGFIQKDAGRTARVTQLSEEDVTHSYELRAVLEGYCARVVAQRKVDLSELEQTVADMRSAADRHNINAFYERDLRFHLLMAEMTGNDLLVQMLRRIIVPLFAFVVTYTVRTQRGQWIESIERHARVIEALKTHDPVFAEHLVVQTIRTFQEHTRAMLRPDSAVTSSGK